MKKVPLFERKKSGPAESLGDYSWNEDENEGWCYVDDKEQANHKFTDEDFVAWASKGNKQIDDLIVDAILNQIDVDEEVHITERTYHPGNDRDDPPLIQFEWELADED